MRVQGGDFDIAKESHLLESVV